MILNPSLIRRGKLRLRKYENKVLKIIWTQEKRNNMMDKPGQLGSVKHAGSSSNASDFYTGSTLSETLLEQNYPEVFLLCHDFVLSSSIYNSLKCTHINATV
jgi:hypothetical protein